MEKPTVKLTGTDGNAYALMGKVVEALRKVGQEDRITDFKKDAMAGDYNNLLVVCNNYCEVE